MSIFKNPLSELKVYEELETFVEKENKPCKVVDLTD